MRIWLYRVAVVALPIVAGCSQAMLSSGLDAPDATELIGNRKFTWVADSAGRVRVYAESGIDGRVPIARIERAAASVDSTLDLMPDSRLISVFVVGSTDRMNTLLGRRVEGRSFYQTGVLAIVPTDNWEATAKHELTHVALGRHWGKASAQWISEGAATWVGNPFYGRDIRILARDRLLRTGKLLPLSTLDDSFGRAPDEVTYLQSAAVVQFIVTRFGIAALRTVWQEGMPAIKRATKLSVVEFEREWREFLGR
jgi:hypothetical protein